MNRSGSYRKNFSGSLAFSSFVPANLSDVRITVSPEMQGLISKAYLLLGQLNGVSRNIKSFDSLLGAYIRKEALLSSQIEGTQATIEDVFKVENPANADTDVGDVYNYVRAMKESLTLVKELPLCNRLLRRLHSILLEGTRGEDKQPGEFRHSQNWIGRPGSSLATARFVPPSPEDMENALSELETYIQNSDDTDILVKTALIHYQFETIHPFLDGNGRIGRMLIVLFLLDQKILEFPSLYISLYLKSNQREYYDRLNDVRLKGHYEEWILFFLKGIIETCQNAMDSIQKLSLLREQNQRRIENRDQWLLDYLERVPIITAKQTFENFHQSSYATVNRAIQRFVDLGILHLASTSKKTRAYVYQDYLDVLKNGM